MLFDFGGRAFELRLSGSPRLTVSHQKSEAGALRIALNLTPPRVAVFDDCSDIPFDRLSRRLSERLLDAILIELAQDGSLAASCDSQGHSALFIGSGPSGAAVLSNDPWYFPLLEASRSAGHLDFRTPLPRGSLVRFSPEMKVSVTTFIQENPRDVVPVARDVRNAVLASVARFDHLSRVAVLLSGGIDSSVIAAAASLTLGARKLTFVNLRLPCSRRDFDTSYARKTARSFGVNLELLDLRHEQLERPHDYYFDAGRHHWFGWWLAIQQQLADRFDAVLCGTAGELFGRDDVRTLPRAFLRFGPAVFGANSLRAIGARNVLRALLRRQTRHVAVEDFPMFSSGGNAMLLANPFLPSGLVTYDPYKTATVLALARAAAGTGARVAKSILREAFSDVLPTEVTSTGRRDIPVELVLGGTSKSLARAVLETRAHQSMVATQQRLLARESRRIG